MRILLLGASGRTGLVTIAEALSRGHTVTALVRNPTAISPQANLTIITGTPLSPQDLTTAFASAPSSDPIQAVISTLNNGRKSDNPWSTPISPTNLMADSVANALAAMRAHNTTKLITLSALGVGSSRARCGWLMRMVIDHSNIKIAFDDHEAVERLLREEAAKDARLKFVEVKATGLSNGEKKTVRVCGEEGFGCGWLVSRKSVAGFMVDAAEREEWDGKTPVISH